MGKALIITIMLEIPVTITIFSLSTWWEGLIEMPFIIIGFLFLLTALERKFDKIRYRHTGYRDTGESGETYDIEYDSDSHNYYSETLAERRP